MKKAPNPSLANTAWRIAIGSLAAASALAQTATPASPAQALLEQPVTVNVGAFLLRTSLRAGLNGQSAENPEVDFDETLGKADSSTRVRADASFRLTPDHHLTALYFDNRSKQSRVLDQSVNWGDTTFDAGATLKSDNQLKVGAVAYEYAFVRQPHLEVAGGIGLHVTALKLTLTGSAVVHPAGGGTTVTERREANSVTAPLPVLGLRASWVALPQLLLQAQGQYFKLKVNDVDGYWSDFRASATWMFNRRFGLGLGYDHFSSKVTTSRSNFDGRIKLGYSGLLVFATASF